MREKVLIVTSGEKMALYAANNISSAVRNFEDRSYARVFGIGLNHTGTWRMKQKKCRLLQTRAVSRSWVRMP